MAQNTFPSPRQARTLARGLGWFSLGLGVVGLLAARRVARAVGLPGHAGLVAAFGVREVVTGIGLPPAPAANHSGRSGWPLPPADMRGVALEDFEPPRDRRIPLALRPWTNAHAAGEGAAAPG